MKVNKTEELIAEAVKAIDELLPTLTWERETPPDQRIVEAYVGRSETALVTVARGEEGPPDGAAMLMSTGTLSRFLPRQAEEAMRLARAKAQ